jgi:hypothetical protein
LHFNIYRISTKEVAASNAAMRFGNTESNAARSSDLRQLPILTQTTRTPRCGKFGNEKSSSFVTITQPFAAFRLLLLQGRPQQHGLPPVRERSTI